MTALLSRVRRALHDPDDPAYGWVEGTIWLLILLSIGLTAVDVSLTLDPAVKQVLDAVDRIVLVVFAIEVSLRVLTFHPPKLDVFDMGPAERLRTHVVGRIAYCFRPLVFIDILTVAALHPALRGLRALRVLRLTRGVRFFRFANPFAHIAAAFEDNKLLFFFAFAFLATETVIGGVTMYLIESPVNPHIDSVVDGMWWTIVTLTTVGYGDITPVAPLGRLWGAVLMVAGMFTLALFAGVIGHTLLHTVLTIREEQFRMSRFTDHVVIIGYEHGSRMLLDAMLAEVNPDATDVVLFGPGERPKDIPPSFKWVDGEPSKEREFAKVHVSHARVVMFVGQRSLPPQAADASTILGVFTVRAFLRKQTDTPKRKRPLHIVAEVLETENVEHARTAGADEVIESTRIGFAMLAHAVTQPGTGDVMASVVSAGAHSVYVARARPWAGQPYGEVAEKLKAEHDALLIGFRRDATGEDVVNPPDEQVIAANDKLLYLATEAVLT